MNVAMLDLDEMKHANDSYGHSAGDAVLKEVSGFLRMNSNAAEVGFPFSLSIGVSSSDDEG